MEKLPPIPTPLGTRWREFRYQFLPIITFTMVVAVVAVMWRSYVVPPNVLAEVEPITVNVATIKAGTLIRLSVERFQRVTNGQEIGEVLVLETNVLTAGLDVIEDDLEVKRAQYDLLTLRDSMIYERERLAFLREVVDLNINKVNLTRATSNYLRASNLFFIKSPVVSQAQYDQSWADYARCKVEVAETERYLVEKSNALPRLKVNSEKVIAAVVKDIGAQSNRLQAINQNLVLRAPIDGMISVINHRQGERISSGSTVVTITPLTSDRIIAYVRQPMNLVPKIDEEVQIRKQTFKRETGSGKVVEVGAQLDRIDPALLASQGQNIRVEMGLPFLVKVKPQSKLALAPGERVDLIFAPRPRGGAN
jgi:multidrug resistance efflux pump